MLCRWPFSHVSIDQNGNFRPCCSWRHEEFVPAYPQVPQVNFDVSSINEYINSPFLKTIHFPREDVVIVKMKWKQAEHQGHY